MPKIETPGRTHLELDALPALCRSPGCLNTPAGCSKWCGVCLERSLGKRFRTTNRELARQYVYAIGDPDTGPIKIGFTSDVPKRLGALQSGSPAPLRLLGLVRGGRDLEQALHRRLRRYRAHGEWFNRAAPVLAVVFLMASGDLEAVKQFITAGESGR